MNEKPKLIFWKSQVFAMLPFCLYIFLGGVFSIGFHYYSMKGLIFSAMLSLITGFFLCKNRSKYWDSVIHGLAQYANARLIFIFLIIGIFSKVMSTGNIGGGFVWLSLRLGIEGSGFVVFSFLASAIISMGAGAPIAALFAVIPIFYPPGILLGAGPAMLTGALISGIFFGDALSPSSQVINTTIMIQHDKATGRPADLLNTMKKRTPYILAAGAVSILIYYFFGASNGNPGDINEIGNYSQAAGLLMLIPIVVLLTICFKTRNLFMGLSFGIVTGLLIGLVSGLFSFSDIVDIDYETGSLTGVIFEGIYGMLDVTVSTILLYGLIAVAVDGGMLEKCCDFILSRDFTKTKRGAESVLMACTMIINVLLAGCVLPSILMFGDAADRIGQASDITPERRSILLMAGATNVSSIIPINSAFVMGSVTIINEIVQNNSFLPHVTPFQVFSAAFYCLILTGVCIFWVLAGDRKINKRI